MILHRAQLARAVSFFLFSSLIVVLFKIMAKKVAKKKQASALDMLYTDITTHSIMVLAIFGLVVSSLATTLLGAQFVMAEGMTLGQTDNAATVAVAIDNLMGSSTMGDHGDRGKPVPSNAPMMDDHGMHMGSTTPSCVPLLIARSLKRGSSGDDVSKLQKILLDQALLASSSVTGFFGPLTEKAVGIWQMQQGIASSSMPDSNTGVGMVGPRTRALFAKCEGRIGQLLSNGSKGMDSDHGSSTMPHPPMLGSTTPPMPLPPTVSSSTQH